MSPDASFFHRVFDGLSEYFGQEIAPYAELERDRTLLTMLEAAVADETFFRTKHWASPLELGIFRACLYSLVRTFEPRVAIETGVLHGLTSLFVLRAMELNGKGRLISIDLPSLFGAPPANKDGCTDTLPPGKPPGWIVDETHAARWSLELGPSLDLLPGILDKNRPIELFLHDSDHSYAVMSGELNLAWPRLAPNGIIVCDNVDMCDAFFDFCRAVGQQPFLVSEQPDSPARFGIVRRST